jgi:hypothetical protein
VVRLSPPASPLFLYLAWLLQTTSPEIDILYSYLLFDLALLLLERWRFVLEPLITLTIPIRSHSQEWQHDVSFRLMAFSVIVLFPVLP